MSENGNEGSSSTSFPTTARFEVSDAGSGVLYLSGPAAIDVLSPPDLAGSRNQREEIVPGSLEPLAFGVVTLQFNTAGTYVLRGFATGFRAGAAGTIEVTVTVSRPRSVCL